MPYDEKGNFVPRYEQPTHVQGNIQPHAQPEQGPQSKSRRHALGWILGSACVLTAGVAAGGIYLGQQRVSECGNCDNAHTSIETTLTPNLYPYQYNGRPYQTMQGEMYESAFYLLTPVGSHLPTIQPFPVGSVFVLALKDGMQEGRVDGNVPALLKAPQYKDYEDEKYTSQLLEILVDKDDPRYNRFVFTLVHYVGKQATFSTFVFPPGVWSPDVHKAMLIDSKLELGQRPLAEGLLNASEIKYS